jgi:hypothetical protein
MEDRVAKFQVAVERNNSNLHKVNSEINTLKAQLTAGSVVKSRSADCNAGEFEAAGDRNDQLDLNPLAQTTDYLVTFQSPLA